MDVEIHRDGFRYTLHFEHGENIGGLKKEPYLKKDTGTRTRWKPVSYTHLDVYKRQIMDCAARRRIGMKRSSALGARKEGLP